MVQGILECIAGEPNWEIKKRRWEKEVAAAVHRLNVRAEEEELQQAMREHRAAEEAAESPSAHPDLPFMYRRPSTPPVYDPTPDPPRFASDPALSDINASHDDRTLALIGVGRFARSDDPAAIRRALLADIEKHGNDFPGKHPLHVHYDWARARVLARGEPDPGELEALVFLTSVTQRLAFKMHRAPTVTRDESGTEVHCGFDTSGRVAVAEVPIAHPIARSALAEIHRNRSYTFDDRLVAIAEERGEDDDGVEEEEETGSVVVASMASTPDPAESIAAYHDRRAKFFCLDADAGVRLTRSWSR